VKPDRLGVGEPPDERAQTGKRPDGPILVVEADRSSRERLGIVRRSPDGGGELTFGRDGTERLLEPDAAEEVQLTLLARPVEGRQERRQAGRRVRVAEILRTDGRRRVRLDALGLPPDPVRLVGLARQCERKSELETDEAARGIPGDEDAQATRGPRRPSGERLAHCPGDGRRCRGIR
jgi:hypothetical protein